MLTQLIALAALIVLAMLTSIGNMWYSYGIWSRSFVALFLFMLASAVVTGLISAVVKTK